jgi:hypothetical protein
MIRQAWGLLALQCTLTLRSWSHGKTIAAITGLAFLIIGCVGAAAVSLGLFTLGSQFIPRFTPVQTLAVLDALVIAFLLVTLWGLLIDIQRNDLFSLQRLLHLPLSPTLVFVVNYLYALLGPATLVFVPGSIALAAGLATARGPQAWLIVPLAAAFYFMASAWVYHARGYIAILLQDKRRRRVLAVLVPAVVILLSQAPTFVRLAGGDRDDMDWRALLDNPLWVQRLEAANTYVPPLWLAHGARNILAGEYTQALLAGAGMCAFGLLGMALGYRATLRHYLTGASPHGARKASAQGDQRPPLTARSLPIVATETGVMACAFFLEYARHPTVRSQLVMPPIMTIVICASAMARSNPDTVEWTGASMPLFLIALPFLGSTMLLFNIFGADVRGFRGLLLLPAPRHRILLAKNIALFPFMILLCTLVLAIAAAMLRTPWPDLLLQALHIPIAYLLFCVVGNVISILLPMPLSRDALRGQGNRLILMVTGLAYALLAAVILAPTMMLLAAQGFARLTDSHLAPIAWWSTAALAAATLILYRATLTYTGDLLTAREKQILASLLRERT